MLIIDIDVVSRLLLLGMNELMNEINEMIEEYNKSKSKEGVFN